MDHAIVEPPASIVFGLGLDCPGWDASGIGRLWERFSSRGAELPAGRIWGVSQPRSDGFYYVAGREVTAGTPLPAGLEAVALPAGRYKRAAFDGPPPQMQAAFAALYSAIPAAGEQAARHGACLELYELDCWDEATGRLRAELYVQLA
jgi:predicted transcriptional regulator YdeE